MIMIKKRRGVRRQQCGRRFDSSTSLERTPAILFIIVSDRFGIPSIFGSFSEISDDSSASVATQVATNPDDIADGRCSLLGMCDTVTSTFSEGHASQWLGWDPPQANKLTTKQMLAGVFWSNVDDQVLQLLLSGSLEAGCWGGLFQCVKGASLVALKFVLLGGWTNQKTQGFRFQNRFGVEWLAVVWPEMFDLLVHMGDTKVLELQWKNWGK